MVEPHQFGLHPWGDKASTRLLIMVMYSVLNFPHIIRQQQLIKARLHHQQGNLLLTIIKQ